MVGPELLQNTQSTAFGLKINERYKYDPELLTFYKRNLLEPGWAGELDRCQLEYIRSELRKSPPLRQRWGFRPSAKGIPDNRVWDAARNGRRRRWDTSFSFAHRRPGCLPDENHSLRQLTIPAPYENSPPQHVSKATDPTLEVLLRSGPIYFS